LAAVQVTLIAAITVVVVALPRLGVELHLSGAQEILVSSGYGLSFSGLLLFGARLGERLGLRHCLLTGLTVFVVGSTAGGLATDWLTLIVARLAQGAGAALTAPTAMALLSVVVRDAAAHRRALASWGVLASVGAMTGTLAGGVLAGMTSWRWCFFAIALAGAAELLAAAVLLPAGPPRVAARLDAAGGLAVTGAISLLSYGLVETTNHAWPSAQVVVSLACGAVLLAVFVVIERRTSGPLVPPRLLARPRRAAGLGAIWVAAAATAGVPLFCSLFFQQIQGHTPLATTARLLPLGVLFVVGAAAVRPLVGRFGAARCAVAGLTGAAAGLALLATLHVGSGYAGPILAGLVIFPAGASLAFAAGTVLSAEDTGAADTGAVAGLATMAMETGPTVGLALLVGLAGAVGPATAGPAAVAHGYGTALRVAAGGLIAMALAVALFRNQPRRSRTCPPTCSTARSR
jgi:MFS family permease